MGSTINGFIVVLKRGVSEDLAEKYRQAILLLDGVASCSNHVESIENHFAVQQAKMEIYDLLFNYKSKE